MIELARGEAINPKHQSAEKECHLRLLRVAFAMWLGLSGCRLRHLANLLFQAAMRVSEADGWIGPHPAHAGRVLAPMAVFSPPDAGLRPAASRGCSAFAGA